MNIDDETLKLVDEFYGEVDVQLSMLGVDRTNCSDLLLELICQYASQSEWEKCCLIEDIVENLPPSAVKNELYFKLLNIQSHGLHQQILRYVQDHKMAEAIPAIKLMLENGLSNFNHRTSEPDVIAKWISWALVGIGTKESIDLIVHFAKSDDRVISQAMQYRLERIKE